MALTVLLVLNLIILTLIGWDVFLKFQASATYTINSSIVVNPRPIFQLSDVLCIAIPMCAIVVLMMALRKGKGSSSVIVWNVHSLGVEVLSGDSRIWIPREEVRRIVCVDSIFGDVSQLQLLRRSVSIGGLLGVTPMIYVRGKQEERRQILRAARAAIDCPL